MSSKWVVADGAPTQLARFVSDQAKTSFNQAKRWIASGKVLVDGAAVTAPQLALVPGQSVELRMHAPKPRDPARRVELVFDDPHIVVIDKPTGMSSVPYERGERDTAMDAIRDAWKAQGKKSRAVPLHVVHRIDKGTSGLLMFAKSKRAEIGLARQLREHSIEREYRCLAHGEVAAGRIESMLVRDRGDGLRGSTWREGQGKRAVTHVEVVRRLAGATLCRVRLETGKTHQIRIHLAEAGHPLVGETVYVRDYLADGHELYPSPRLMLHARTLGFEHPITGERLALTREPPADFAAVLEGLR